MQEIVSEEWGNIKFENTYYEDYLITKALNDGLKKVYGQEQMKFRYPALNCIGEYNANFQDAIKYICNIDEKDINIYTFDSLKNEFNMILNMLKSYSTGALKTENIHSNELEIKYFDIAKFDNIIFGSSVIRSYNFLNSQLLKFDVIFEEVCYDYPTINFEINATEAELIVDFIGTNEYNEKVQYVIKIIK